MATVKLPHVTEERALEATLVIEVTKSLIGPHRVILGDHGHFYARTSTGKYRLDVSDLRQAFGASARLFDRIRDFHVDRLLRVGRRAYDLLLQRGSHHVEHVPLAFGRQALAVDARGAIGIAQRFLKKRTQKTQVLDSATLPR